MSLSDEEIDKIYQEFAMKAADHGLFDYNGYARAIEARLKEKSV